MLQIKCANSILEMSQECDISRHFKGNFKTRRDISARFSLYNGTIKKARFSLYNGTIKKKGGRTYAYFTDNRFEKILWGRAEHYKGSGRRFSLGGTRRICRHCRHIRQWQIHTAEYDRRSGCSHFRQGHCGWQRFIYSE